MSNADLTTAKCKVKKNLEMDLLWIFVTIFISVVNATATPELILRDKDGKTGKLTEATPNFGESGWKIDEGSNVQAVKGRWILYKDINYEGIQWVMEEGKEINVGHNTHYSSARPSFLKLKLYEKKVDEKGGKDITIYGATPNFQLVSDWLNDEASSVEALSGTWELFEHSNYEGNRMVVVEGARQGVLKNDHYSSARPVCSYEKNAATAKIRVFEHTSQQGASKDFFVDTQLEDMDDKISSIRVFSGIWELYQHGNFEGKWVRVQAPVQMDVKNDYYSSLRPVCETYLPTPGNCTVTSITVHNNQNLPKKDETGTQIVGILLDSSCQGGSGTKGHLVMDRTDSVEESVGIETGKDREINWGLTVGVSTQVGLGVETEVSMEASVGGARTLSESKSKETTTGYSQSAGFELEYNTPAVAVLFGSVDKYTIDAADVPTTLHMECPDGPRNQTSEITLTSTSYASADYWYLIKNLEQDVCDLYYEDITKCMQKFKETYSKKFESRKNIKADFEECFNFYKFSLNN